MTLHTVMSGQILCVVGRGGNGLALSVIEGLYEALVDALR